MSCSELIPLWTWQNPGWDITTQGWSSHNLNSDWGRATARTLLPRYEKVWPLLGTRDFVWCFLEYQHWDQLDIRKLWVLQAPRSQVLRYVNDPVWESLRKQSNSQPIPDSLWLSEDQVREYVSEGKSADVTVLLKVPIEKGWVVDSTKFNKGPACCNAKYEDLPTGVEVGNEVIRLEFDPRTSDTMYNYVWVRRAGDGPSRLREPRGLSPLPARKREAGGEPQGDQRRSWERVHNFGIDVGAYRSDTGGLINTIGMNLIVSRGASAGTDAPCSREPRGRPHRAGGRPPLPVPAEGLVRTEGRAVRVRYPHPLIQYRQFDDKIGTPEKVAKYPDFTVAEMPGLVHADASLEFLYEVDPERPSFVVSGRVLTGKVHHVVYIIDALWTDNHALPTHEYVDGVGEFDIRTPEAARCKEVEVEGASGSLGTRCVGPTLVADKSAAAGARKPREAALPFALFYRDDGDGVPFALVPQSPERARFCNFYDNYKCLQDFRAASLNQQFIPREPPVTGCNDTGYIVSPREDGTLPGVRLAFFPELGWGRGGAGPQLRDQLLATIREQY